MRKHEINVSLSAILPRRIRVIIPLAYVLSSWLLIACSDTKPASQVNTTGVRPTAIRRTGNAYELLRYGQPYFIRGAGSLADGDQNRFERLKACGGNSIRIWDDNEADQVLDEAQRLGMTVFMGVSIARELEGFDYNDQPAIDKQFARVRKLVLKYRNHPALLMWCVGNESALKATNLNVYDEINRITRMIHQLDPGHPVTTAVSLDSERSIWLVRERCPDLDILSVNAYGETLRLREFLDKGGWTGPYIFSEFGNLGYWQVALTPWGTPIEPTSQQKYDFVQTTYTKYIGARPPACLGAYFFVWGSKQEETHTWFSLFDEQGRETPLIGLIQQLWTKRSPANQAPVVRQLLIDHYDTTSVSFSPSATIHRAQVVATDPDGDSLTYRWEVRAAASQRSAFENTPLPIVDGVLKSANTAVAEFSLPRQPGSYRLFVYIYDTRRHVAGANLAFRVTPGL